MYVVGAKVEHTGFPWQALPERMGELVAFIHEESEINDLLKAALIHFYMAYLHPYFDGNGRMARLMHLWYLVQQGYSSALFVPLSEYINKSRKGYYDAYTLVEENARISGMLDATPFLVYFIENVYHKLNGALPTAQTTAAFQDRPVPRTGHREGKSTVGVCSVRLRRRGVFHQAVGKGLRERRLRDDPQLCVEV